VLSLYVDGDGLLHRARPGVKIVLVLVVVLAISLLPTAWWALAPAVLAPVALFLLCGLGMPQLGRQLWALRWLAVVSLIGQVIFLGIEPAVINTVRVLAAVAAASVLALTTRVTALLGALEVGLAPLRFVRIDPERTALLLVVTFATIPVLASLAGEVRETLRARGARATPRAFTVPYVVLALQHADRLGEALAARGVG
jgi:biotin transport system permease protein